MQKDKKALRFTRFASRIKNDIAFECGSPRGDTLGTTPQGTYLLAMVISMAVDFHRQNHGYIVGRGGTPAARRYALVIDKIYFSKRKLKFKNSSQISSGIGEVPRTLCAWVADEMKLESLMRLKEAVNLQGFLLLLQAFLSDKEKPISRY